MGEDLRVDPPHEGDERAVLCGFLEYQRETLAWKCSGLSAAQLRVRAVPPSELSLLGLVRHMTDVERGWFLGVVGGEDVRPFYWADDRRQDVDFAVDDADPDEAFRLWREACARSREVVASAESLDVAGVHRRNGSAYSLRWVLTHMIEEYARHNGHADLLRERIDGATGE
ncbi:DinB family protein [Actinomadura atramentaria]|uniref:DinB family protein n=1 Tax=Actinomadura atramentaria TaxID=1990 RepID=UPI000373ED98|nr:DinB family protein [Actinomadura atramentaria]